MSNTFDEFLYDYSAGEQWDEYVIECMADTWNHVMLKHSKEERETIKAAEQHVVNDVAMIFKSWLECYDRDEFDPCLAAQTIEFLKKHGVSDDL